MAPVLPVAVVLTPFGAAVGASGYAPPMKKLLFLIVLVALAAAAAKKVRATA
jgi:hypothetical protein